MKMICWNNEKSASGIIICLWQSSKRKLRRKLTLYKDTHKHTCTYLITSSSYSKMAYCDIIHSNKEMKDADNARIHLNRRMMDVWLHYSYYIKGESVEAGRRGGQRENLCTAGSRSIRSNKWCRGLTTLAVATFAAFQSTLAET